MKALKQVAALPVRRTRGGKLKVLLVTSRETRRWVIPKGWPWAKLADHKAAAGEAWEEAGIKGKASSKKIGSFTYDKRRKDGLVKVTVTVYLLEVEDVARSWPEAKERRRAWFTTEAAAAAVSEPGLKAILLALDTPPTTALSE